MKKLTLFSFLLLICSFSEKQLSSPESKRQTLQMLLDSLSHKENLVVDSTFKMRTIRLPKDWEVEREFCKSKNHRIEFSKLYNAQYLQIDSLKFDLNQFYFWRTGKKEQIVAGIHYSIDCTSVKRFRFISKEYIFFDASYYMCNGTGCAVKFYFLYNISDKKFFAFKNFRGYIEVGDVDGDEKLDILQVLPKDAWERMDVAYITPFSLSETGTYKPMSDGLGKPYRIWFKIDDRGEWYSIDKKITVLQSHWLTN